MVFLYHGQLLGEARELIEDGYVLSYNGGFINRVGDPTPLTTCGLSNECANAIHAKGSNSDSACTSTSPTATCS